MVAAATPLNTAVPMLNGVGAIVHPPPMQSTLSFTDRVVSIYEFSAQAGSNVTDDTAAFVAANAFCATNTGFSLYVPNGTYLIGGTVNLTCPLIMGPLASFNVSGGTLTGVYVNAPYRARAVVTTLQAYGGTGTNTLTETSNGAISAADGVTLAVGDVVFIQAGTTNLTGALDSGPWVVSALGSAGAKWVLVRPSWWQTGSLIPVGQVIDIGGEGTNYSGEQWKSFAAANTSNVIGTNDPAFYIRQFVSAITLVTGFIKIGPTQTFPGLRSTAVGNITFTPTNFSGAGSTVSYRTGVYASGGSATAAGYMGTSTVSITALVAAGTFNTSDVGTGLLTIQNW